jgi:hypothetical protein
MENVDERPQKKVVLSHDGACMAGLKGKTGPPGNMNAFKHGLAFIQKRREERPPYELRNTNMVSGSDKVIIRKLRLTNR